MTEKYPVHNNSSNDHQHKHISTILSNPTAFQRSSGSATIQLIHTSLSFETHRKTVDVGAQLVQ